MLKNAKITQIEANLFTFSLNHILNERKTLSLRSEFHLRRKESMTFSRRQETSIFPSRKA